MAEKERFSSNAYAFRCTVATKAFTFARPIISIAEFDVFVKQKTIAPEGAIENNIKICFY